MSLLAWYPLTSNGKNQGLDGIDLDTMGTVEYTTGKLGNSAAFVGNAANCFHRPYFSELTTNFTWCCWFKYNKSDTNDSYYKFILSQGRDYDKFGFNILLANGHLQIWYGHKDDASKINKTLQVAYCTENVWYHVAVTVDETGVKVYLNGELKASSPYEIPDYTYAEKKFTVGKMAHGYSFTTNYHPFNGQICDVRIYNEVISLKEIKEIAKGLILHYKLGAIGGDNLSTLTNSKIIPTINRLNNYNFVKTDYEDYTEIACTTAGTGFYFSLFPRSDDKVGKTYTWSFYGKCNVQKTGSVGHEAGGQKTITLTPEWQRFTHTWTFNTSTYSAFTFYMNWAVGEILSIKDFKIEEGNNVTPWCPSKAEALYNTLGLNTTEENDLSGYKNHGLKSNITKITSDSMRYNSSYNFTNSDRINCANIPFENMEQGTMSFWIKFNKFKNWSHYVFFANSFNWTGQEMDFIIVSNSEKIVEETTSTSLYIDCCSYGAAFNVDIDKWYHITITWDAKNYIIKKYINGNLVQTVDDSTKKRLDNYRAKHGTHGIGNIYANAQYAGDFNMSDFRIYSTNLSELDIQSLYNNPISVTKNSTLFSYDFEEV